MTHLAEVRSDLAPPPISGGTRGLLRWVCTSNPFYVLSAMLVCIGLWVSFGGQVVASQTWALLSGMAGYTLLLAVTACLLVRFVGVWDDVRTLLLLVVLMFLATSVVFDEVLARDPGRGVACYLVGLLFAVAVSEGMLRGIRLSLPPLLRVPYYLALALFFLYPVALAPLVDRPRSEELWWGMFGFSPAAGLVALALLPAARRGRAYVRDNGSPWRWAWYPWTLFGLLAFAVPARSALLCWSMHHVSNGSVEPYIFGPYFLAPFLLCAAVLLLEIGLVERIGGVIGVAMAIPPALVALAMVGHRPEEFYRGFLDLFTARLGGTPPYLILLASAGFYGYASLRRVRGATEWLSASLAGLAIVGPATLDLDGLASPRPWPILAVALLQLGLGLREHRAWRCMAGAALIVASATLGLPGGTGPGGLRVPVAFHLILGAALVIGAAFDDPLGRLLRNLGAVAGVAAGLVVLTGRLGVADAAPAWAMGAYPLGMAALLASYGFLIGHRPALRASALLLSAWLAAIGWQGYASARMVVAGLDYLAVGMILFLLAVLTSIAKGGLLSGSGPVGKGMVPDAVGPVAVEGASIEPAPG